MHDSCCGIVENCLLTYQLEMHKNVIQVPELIATFRF